MKYIVLCQMASASPYRTESSATTSVTTLSLTLNPTRHLQNTKS